MLFDVFLCACCCCFCRFLPLFVSMWCPFLFFSNINRKIAIHYGKKEKEIMDNGSTEVKPVPIGYRRLEYLQQRNVTWLILHNFLGNSFHKIWLQKDFFFFFYHTLISHVQKYSYAIIWLLPLWPQQLWDCDACVLYNNIPPPHSFLSHLLSSLPLLYVYADDVSKHSLAPLTAVKSNISALFPLQRRKTQFESIKNAGLFGLVLLINID